MTHDDFDIQVTGVAALGEPIRRALYRYLMAQDRAVSRDDAAAGIGVPRHVAKFHLDKLEEDGLVEAEFSRPPGRSGPGAGRPAKLYRRSPREWSVSLPERRYDFAGRLMVQAISAAESSGAPVSEALQASATEAGRAMGEDARRRAGPAFTEAQLLSAARQVLGEYGYEPRPSASLVTLANCPFHALAKDYTELVCGMNLDLMRGLVKGLGSRVLEARLEPAPDRCCVVLGPSQEPAGPEQRP